MSLLSLSAKHAIRGGIAVDAGFEILKDKIYAPNECAFSATYGTCSNAKKG